MHDLFSGISKDANGNPSMENFFSPVLLLDIVKL